MIFQRICNEFGINHNFDFRLIKGYSHGLGNVYVWFTNKSGRINISGNSGSFIETQQEFLVLMEDIKETDIKNQFKDFN